MSGFSDDTQMAQMGSATINSSTTIYVHPDILGSTNVTTGSSGHLAEALSYYPYGATHLDLGTQNTEQRKYIGQLADPESGLTYLNARYQDPQRGQFLSEDPSFLAIGNPSQVQQLTGQDQNSVLTDPQQLNSYSYGRDNPITQKDPSGNFDTPVDAAIAAGFIGYDLHSIYQNGLNGHTAGNLGLDSLGLIPIVPGFAGELMRSGKIANGLTLGQDFGKFGKVVETIPGELNSFTNTVTKNPYHGLDQAITRGMSPQLIKETALNPLVKLQQGENSVYLSKQAGVVLDKFGGLITAYPKTNFKGHVLNVLNKIK